MPRFGIMKQYSELWRGDTFFKNQNIPPLGWEGVPKQKQIIELEYNTVYPTTLETGEKMSVDPCCRANRGKINYEDRKGTKITMSVDPCVGYTLLYCTLCYNA